MSDMHEILKYVGAALHSSPSKGKIDPGLAKQLTGLVQPQAAQAPAQQAQAPQQQPQQVAPAAPASPAAPPPQGPVQIPFKEFFALMKGNSAHAEAVLPGITDYKTAQQYMEHTPNGVMVTVPADKLAEFAGKAHGRMPAPVAPAPAPAISSPTASIMQQHGLGEQDLYPAPQQPIAQDPNGLQ